MSIGGYFELELRESEAEFHAEALALQSARACLYAFLRERRPERVHVPGFICDSMLTALSRLSIEVSFYTLDERLLPQGGVELRDGDMFLLVNYFGVLTERIAEFCHEVPKDRVILDNAQALFAPVGEFAATLYSPRKFCGLPDGGFLYSGLSIERPQEKYPGHEHLRHLALRACGKVEEGYKYFQESEKALADPEPRLMSDISLRLLHSQDPAEIERSRNRNFNCLAQVFGDHNQLQLDESVCGPLCYPLLLDRSTDHYVDELAARGVFLARYWPECRDRNLTGRAREMCTNTLYLPVDQRLTEDTCERLIATVSECVGLVA